MNLKSVLSVVLLVLFTIVSRAYSDQIIYQPGPSEGKDMWWSSYYDYGSPYHVVNDSKLQVGGWGDSYYTFIQFNLNCLPKTADTAYLNLRAYPNGSSTLVSMQLWVSTTDWKEDMGWSGALYGIYQYTTIVPTPGQWLHLDITGIYNKWKNGTWSNKGLILTPVSTNNNSNFFYSSDFLDDPSLRPSLEVNYTPQANQPFKVCFPMRLPDQGVYTASISSVFDHSMGAIFTTDNKVVAYTGEMGNYQGHPNDPTCISQTSGAFSIGGQYTGASECGGKFYLSYDGHPGIDYPVSLGTPVYATADGKITLAECPYKSSGQSCTGSGSGYGKLYIDHGNGFITSYNHLSATADGLIQGISVVKKGQLVGYSGQTSPYAVGPHLHLSIIKNGIYVDPYGWIGSGADPYSALHGGVQNINLWEQY